MRRVAQQLLGSAARFQRRVSREMLAAQRRGEAGGEHVADSVQDANWWGDKIPHAFTTVAVDNCTALYTKCTTTGRPYQVWQHYVGCRDDYLAYQNDNPHCSVGVSLTRDKRFAALNANTRTSSEIHLLPLTSEGGGGGVEKRPTFLVREREKGVEYYMEHSHDRFYIFTNLSETREYKVMVADTDKPCDWSDLFIPKDGLVLHDIEVYQHYIVLYGAKWLAPVVMVMDAQDTSKEPTLLCEPNTCHVESAVEEDWSSDSLSFSFSTPITPPTYLRYHDSRAGSHDLSCDNLSKRCDGIINESVNYQTECVFASTEDEIKIPITLCYHGDKSHMNHSNPLLVHVYGAYGERLHLGYQPEKMPLVDRGWVLALCHVRGGGELGRRWYYEGQGHNKHNTFKDLHACVTHLHSLGISQPSLTALHGRSAGGMAVAIFANLWPSLLQAAVLHVPFVDVLSSLSNPSLYLSVKDHVELANPLASKSEKDYVASICPNCTLKVQDYPAVMVMGAKHDEVIPFEGVCSYVERLRHHCEQFKSTEPQKSKKNSTLFNGDVSRGTVVFEVDNKHGHYGSHNVLERYKEASKQLLFLHKALKLPLN